MILKGGLWFERWQVELWVDGGGKRRGPKECGNTATMADLWKVNMRSDKMMNRRKERGELILQSETSKTNLLLWAELLKPCCHLGNKTPPPLMFVSTYPSVSLLSSLFVHPWMYMVVRMPCDYLPKYIRTDEQNKPFKKKHQQQKNCEM